MELEVAPEQEGQRVDALLAAAAVELSRAQVQRLIAEGVVTLNGAPTKPSVRVRVGDLVTVAWSSPQPSAVIAQEIPLDIVFEDEHLVVVNKPQGMVVHPAPGAEDGTLVNALLAHCAESLSGIGGVERPGIVHRLDKDTSGLLVVAKSDRVHRALQAQIQSRTMKRIYHAIVWGSPRFEQARIEVPVGRHPTDRLRMAALPDGEGRTALTEVTVLARLRAVTELECRLQTGRTHQIRVHCQFAGHPVVGDPLYGGLRRSGDAVLDALVSALPGQLLHAQELLFTHPITGAALSFQVPPPPSYSDFVRSVTSTA